MLMGQIAQFLPRDRTQGVHADPNPARPPGAAYTITQHHQNDQKPRTSEEDSESSQESDLEIKNNQLGVLPSTVYRAGVISTIRICARKEMHP